MAYQFESVKLDKGMYSESGKSFTKVWKNVTRPNSIRAHPWSIWTPFSDS